MLSTSSPDSLTNSPTHQAAPAKGTGATNTARVFECDAPKVAVCHIPPGNPANEHSICVGDPAVNPHRHHHGDTIGSPCASDLPPPPGPTPPPPPGPTPPPPPPPAPVDAGVDPGTIG